MRYGGVCCLVVVALAAFVPLCEVYKSEPSEVADVLARELIGGADCGHIKPLVCNFNHSQGCPLCSGIVTAKATDQGAQGGKTGGNKVTCGGIKNPSVNCVQWKVWDSSATCGSGGA